MVPLWIKKYNISPYRSVGLFYVVCFRDDILRPIPSNDFNRDIRVFWIFLLNIQDIYEYKNRNKSQ